MNRNLNQFNNLRMLLPLKDHLNRAGGGLAPPSECAMPGAQIKRGLNYFELFNPRILFGWGTRIRTLVGGVRVRSPAARRFPKESA